MAEIKIHSLCTVGILKHYNQNYLFHEQRTDFTGQNGVGKSIIADLLQIIFVAKRKYIKFGTTGINPDKRAIHTLPYKQNEAYAFLNIEAEENKFIVVGICISSNKGTPLRPFVILNSSNLNSDMQDILLDSPLEFNAFLSKSNRILPIQKAASKLANTDKVFLTYFTYSDDLNKYYSFLYNKGILPINLANDTNLKAFSTVLQSFSRANTLKLSSSRSLKDFLFETTEDELLKEYKKLESNLSELLTGYLRLDSKIKDITRKQQKLTKLKELENAKSQIKFEYHKSKLILNWNNNELASKNLENARKELDSNTNSQKKSSTRKQRIERLLKIAESQKTEVEDKIELLNNYALLSNKTKPIESEIKALKELELPNVGHEDLTQIAVQDFKLEAKYEDIKSLVPKTHELLTRYSTVKNLEVAYDEQQKVIESINGSLKGELNAKSKLLKVLNETEPESLLGHVLKKKKSLTREQETILISLLDVGLTKPPKPTNRSRFATSTDLINTHNIELDSENNGSWLKMGEIKEFFTNNNEHRLFDDSKNFSTMINERAETIKKEIEQIKHQIFSLSQVKKGSSYDKSLLDREFDLDISDYSNIKNTKTVLEFLAHKNKRISSLEESIRDIFDEKVSLEKQLKIEGDNIPELQNELNSKRKVKDIRVSKLSNTLANETNILTKLETELARIQIIENTAVSTFDDCKTELESSTELFSEKYPDIDIDFLKPSDITVANIETVETNLNQTEQDYFTEYKTLVNLFEETKNERDLSVKLQIENRIYGFSILEQTLLGNKIKHLDNITPVLKDMNLERAEFVNDIYEKMIKIFSKTREQYERYETLIKDLNRFFKDKKISEEYYFSLVFSENNAFSIDWIYNLQEKASSVFLSDELQMGETVENFIEDFFSKVTSNKAKVNFEDLLNPKTYFELSVKLVDENGYEIPGSTGETYSAIVLLGIARLSKVQGENRNGLKFIILEESSNLDNTNFNTFPKVAKENGYQIITMTPKPYGSDSADGWYLHHLIKGKTDNNINYPIPASYFKTKNSRQDLKLYLQK